MMSDEQLLKSYADHSTDTIMDDSSSDDESREAKLVHLRWSKEYKHLVNRFILDEKVKGTAPKFVATALMAECSAHLEFALAQGVVNKLFPYSTAAQILKALTDCFHGRLIGTNKKEA